MFNVPHVTNPNLTIINPTSFLVTPGKNVLVSKVDSVDANLAAFDCAIYDNAITCVLTSNGVFIKRVVLTEQLEGLVVKGNPQLYQIYDDTYPIKITMNKRFFVVLSMSPKYGTPKVLVYNANIDMGSQYIWSGINLIEHTQRTLQDIDIFINSKDNLLITVNDKLGTAGKPSLVRSFALSNATITLKNPQYSELGKYKLLINGASSGIEQVFISLPNLFLTNEEQKGIVAPGEIQWYHWALALVVFGLVFGGIYKQMRGEFKRRQQLRAEVLCNNLGDELHL